MDSPLHIKNFMNDVMLPLTETLLSRAMVAHYDFLNSAPVPNELQTSEERTHENQLVAPQSPSALSDGYTSIISETEVASSPIYSTDSLIWSPTAYSERQLPSPPSSDAFQEEVGLGLSGIEFADEIATVQSDGGVQSSPLTSISAARAAEKKCGKWRSEVPEKLIEVEEKKRPLEVETEVEVPTKKKKKIVSGERSRNDADIYLVSITEVNSAAATITASNILQLSPASPIVSPFILNIPYTFNSASTPENPVAIEWTVTFTSAHTSTIHSNCSTSRDDQLRFTFHRLRPHSVFLHPSCKIGSIDWWRLQTCDAHHWVPGDQRPSRIVDHFAGCKKRGRLDALGGLARAIQEGFPMTTVRKRGCEKV